jgi:hypothetical protein
MRFLVVALLMAFGLFFFYKEQLRRVLDDLTEVNQIKASEDEAFVAAGGKPSAAKPSASDAPVAPSPGQDKHPPVGEKKAAPAKTPAIQPVGTAKRYELTGTDPDRK